MRLTTPYPKAVAFVLAAAVLAVAWGSIGPGSAAASDGIPANRMSASGSALDILSVPLEEGEQSETHTILSGQVKLSNPWDLIFRVTAECALWTNIAVTGESPDSESIASVKLWVEVDGTPVPVAEDDTGDDAGKVVFCNRAFRMVLTNFEDDQKIETYLKTRSANSFNWFTQDVSGSAGNVHTIEVKALLESKVTGAGMAQAGIGKRTLIVEPVNFGNSM